MTNLIKASPPVLAVLALLSLRGFLAAQPTAEPAPIEALEPSAEMNPAVRAALELPREEPADYFQAVGWLIDLGRADLAKPIFDELTKLPMTAAQRAALVEEFGSGRMLQLAQTNELAPEAAAFAETCMAAAAAVANDPQRIARLVAQLRDPSAEIRFAARNDLAATGQAGATATLEAWARETDPGRRRALMAAAATMEPLVVGPLLAMLSTNDAALRADVGRLLKHLGVTQAVPFLPSSSAEAERRLTSALARYSAGVLPFAPNENDQLELWHWNDATKRLTAARYPADQARIIWNSRLARALARAQPHNRQYQRQAWLYGLEAAGIVSTTQNLLSRIEVGLVNDVLADALAHNFNHAAVAAANELGRRRNAEVLYTPSGQPSPLADALRHADRRVRFAALAAIMALDPSSPYPGSSRVPEALAWFARANGERRAIVAMPTNLAASDLAGMLAAHDLEADITNRGREAVDMARETPDLEVVFVDMGILRPAIRQVLYELRAIPETGPVPIGLLAADGQLNAAERLASEHDRVLAMPRPHSAEVVARNVEQLRQLSAVDAVSPGQRAAEALQSMNWLAQLLSRDRALYDLTRTAPAIEAALYRSLGAAPAIAALARLGTPESQRALLNFASQSTLPSAPRLQAAEAFGESVNAHGVLLTTDEILAQYERYNASADADAQTQQILGGLLDAIESRRDSQSAASFLSP